MRFFDFQKRKPLFSLAVITTLLVSATIFFRGLQHSDSLTSKIPTYKEVLPIINPDAPITIKTKDLTIGTKEPLHSVEVSKYDESVTINGATSINKIFNIHPEDNIDLDAEITFSYEDSDLNGLSEDDLILYSSTDKGKTWQPHPNSIVDPLTNSIHLDGIEHFSLWTAGAGSAMVSQASATQHTNYASDCPFIIKKVGELSLCAQIGNDATHPLANLDCDGGGEDNITECLAGQDPTDPTDDVSGCAGTTTQYTVVYDHSDIANNAPFAQGVNTGTYTADLKTGSTTTTMTWQYGSDNLTGNANPLTVLQGQFLALNEYLDVAGANLFLAGDFAEDYDHGGCSGTLESTLVKRQMANPGVAQVGSGTSQSAVKTCFQLTFIGASYQPIDGDNIWRLMSSSGGTYVYEICIDGTLTSTSGIWEPIGQYGPEFEGDFTSFEFKSISNECATATCSSTAGPGGTRFYIKDTWSVTCCN